MNRHELKKILKPLIKECIKEVIFEDGTLSTIISEVVKGTTEQQVVTEIKQPTFSQQVRNPDRKRKQLQEQRKKMLEAVGKDSYNGVDLFEGTTPIKNAGTSGPRSAPGILEGVDPGDAGVDLSHFGISKNIMKKMMGK